jgi:hypothetical protein
LDKYALILFFSFQHIDVKNPWYVQTLDNLSFDKTIQAI